MTKPSDEQIIEFWKRYLPQSGDFWFYNGRWNYNPPVIDLNNLFLLLVPKLKPSNGNLDVAFFYDKYSEDIEAYLISNDFSGQPKESRSKDADPALALFWALWRMDES